MGKLTIKNAIFNSYLKLPVGKPVGKPVWYHMALDFRINDAAMLLTQESQKYDPEVLKMSQEKLHSVQKW